MEVASWMERSSLHLLPLHPGGPPWPMKAIRGGLGSRTTCTSWCVRRNHRRNLGALFRRDIALAMTWFTPVRAAVSMGVAVLVHAASRTAECAWGRMRNRRLPSAGTIHRSVANEADVKHRRCRSLSPQSAGRRVRWYHLGRECCACDPGHERKNRSS